MSVDQRLLYRSCIAVIEGVCPVDLAKRTLGAVSHSRWLTLALRINFMYMSCPEPSAELTRLCWFVINVYALLWFSAKVRWRATEGPILTHQAAQLINNLPATEKAIVCPVFERGFSYWAHCEQVLLAMLASQDADIRSRAITKILKIRESASEPEQPPAKKSRKSKTTTSVRIFQVPSINCAAANFHTMIDFDREQATEPPYTMKYSNTDLRQFETHPLVLDVPNNSQFVERLIRVITENGTMAATPKLRDGLSHAKISHRQQRGKKESQADFTGATQI